MRPNKKSKKTKAKSFQGLQGLPMPSRKSLLVFAVGFALVGTLLVLATRAATPTASLEAENGTVTGPATTGSDSTASGGSYVQFKTAQSGGACGRSIAWCTLGVFPGYGDAAGTTEFQNFENWLGHQLTFADANLDGQSWNGTGVCNGSQVSVGSFLGSAWGQFTSANNGMFSTLQRVKPTITVGITVRPDCAWTSNASVRNDAAAARFQEVISGADDSYYMQAAHYMADNGHGDAVIRLGHEADLDWYPWSMTGGNHELYKQAFRHIVGLFRSVSPNFKFDYQGDGSWDQPNPSAGNIKFAESGYPGDDVVDYIGCDVYDTGNWTPGNGWQLAKAKLDYTRNLAISHGKQMSIPEWGLWANDGSNGGGDDDPAFIQSMYDWINSTPTSGPGSLAYQVYFNDLPQHNLDNFPNSKAKFKQLFGN